MLEATNAHQITLLNGKITKMMILSKNLQIHYTLTVTKVHTYEVRRGERFAITNFVECNEKVVQQITADRE